MKKKTLNWNIAFEISPILAASGSFGDKSGVYRINYNLIKYLSTYFHQQKLPHQIFLYTINPTLLFNMNIDLYELLKRDNVHLLKLPNLTSRYLHEYPIFNHLGIRYVAKLINKLIYKRILEKTLFQRYLGSLSEILRTNHVRVVHHSESGFVDLPGFANVIHINDIVPIKFPFWQRKLTVEIHKRKLNFTESSAQGVICISESTKRDLLDYLPRLSLPDRLVRVIFPGADNHQTTNSIPLADLNHIISGKGYSVLKKDNYFLYFGTIEPRKNIPLLVTVFNHLLTSGTFADAKLTLVGGRGWGKTYDDLQRFIAENYPISSDSPIIFLDFLNDNYLASLIKNARAVVYPSLYEGFGLPVAESMRLGTPVITSNVASLPEVAGDACLTIDPLNPEALESAMIKIYRSPTIRASLSQKGLKQSAQFTWANCAKSTYQFYVDLLRHLERSS
jgi:glycosyltransferase involved in cell wall biosynthesis